MRNWKNSTNDWEKSSTLGFREQLSLDMGVVRVLGKGSKERLVPLGEEALAWVRRYLAEGRPTILHGRVADALFVTARAEPMTRQAFWQLIKRYAAVVELPRAISPHTLRHASPPIY